MNYPIFFREQDAGYQIEIPDLNGCNLECISIDEGYRLVKPVIADHLAILAEYGEKIPQAKSISFYQKQYPQVIWAVVNIDITPYLGKSHKINVTLPELLIKQIDDRVNKSELYKTRSGFIASACLNELAKNS
ncbi:MAG: type II toxin-antitoxin system HicB family antitoxin [Thalassotalea sp.]